MAEAVIVHSVVDVSVDPNRTAAFFSFTKPENGGMDISVDRVKAALTEKGVCFGLLEENIALAVEQKRYDENVCAARWLPPENGVDGKIKYYYKTESNIAPVENEHGVVDYKNLGLVRNITAGTTIAVITLPTEGTPGKDVTGREVPQKQGVAAKVNVGVGTSLINNDTEIIASVDGNLEFKNGTFCVMETLIIPGDVDVSSGNIDFIGSVTVKGNVAEGFRVTSKKDISILGSAMGAEISAAGNINVKMGCINSTVNCSGDIRLGFCENSKIRCEGSVESGSYIGGEIFAGKNIVASGNGNIVGGKYTALNSVDAGVIGSENYTKTEITLGNNAVLSEERSNLCKQIEDMDGKSEQLTKVLVTLNEYAKKSKLSPKHEQMKAEALRSRLKLQAETKKAKLRIEEIDRALQLTQDLSVGCRKMIYPGVTIRINSCILQVNAVENRVRARVDEGEIKFKPY